MKKHKDVHEFSLYWPDTVKQCGYLQCGALFYLDDDMLYHRLIRVLRLEPGAPIILFDQQMYVRAEFLGPQGRNTMTFKLLEKQESIALKPAITFFLPLLKRDALEQAMYSLVELGVTTIQLMHTQKVQRAWGGQRELDRLHTIMIAAAEQAKQYHIPTLLEPKPFEACVQHMDAAETRFFFDPQGDNLLPVLQRLYANAPQGIHLMIGPEGDLTASEKEQLIEHKVQFLSLSPTILRAQQAVAVSMGIFRSLL